ncbi:DUF1214 domain-containing protein [Archangium violaceum]|uniref:DUF1214 domain-containing protein n=1 Tax=Archangium violaceum TaxID=83451 RepID=UPI0036DD9210
MESPLRAFSVDSLAPGAPVVVTPAPGAVVNTSAPVVSGTAEPGSTVTLFLDGVSVGSTTTHDTGTWSFTPGTALAQGRHAVTARATDAAGHTGPVSPPHFFSVDSIAPDAPVVVTPAPSAVVNTKMPVINPPEMVFTNMSNEEFNTIHSNDFTFYEELARIIKKEPVEMLDPELRGLIASIGIEKGRDFDPDDRMKQILTDAVAVGNATARAIDFQTREREAYLYEDSEWKTGFLGSSYKWLKNDGLGGRYLDARTLFFYMATVNTPAMEAQMIGKGSQYAYINKDSEGRFLDGGKDYRLRIPPNVPAEEFWSFVVYDPQTRSQLQTDHLFPSKSSQKGALQTEDDGSIYLYFGPQPPPGRESNWIQTIKDKGWFGMIRLYGPLEPWFKKEWRPGEIEMTLAATPVTGR